MSLTETFNILGVRISVLNPEKFMDVAGKSIARKEKIYVCVAPVSTIIDCQDDPLYRNVVNSADMVTPDGMPVAWLGRLKGYQEVRRTYGADLMRLVCERGQKEGFQHYFYGGSKESSSRLLENLRSRYPDIRIAGAHVPGKVEVGDIEAPEVIAKINASGAEVLWVGLGSPKQDFWMRDHRDKINVPVMVGVGAAFDFLAGTKPQAPRWMQKSGLEWLFRLCCEPRRLWKRYLVGNSRFVYLIVKDLIFGKPQSA